MQAVLARAKGEMALSRFARNNPYLLTGGSVLSPQNGIIMKTIMNFSMDENGNVEITTDNEELFDKFFNITAGEKAEKHFRDLMAKMVGIMWGDRNTCMSKAIRLLSMAEVCCCGAPYEQAEDFWSTMMFSCIPASEKYLNPLKSFYGFNPKNMVRPKTFGDGTIFQIGKPNGYPWRGGK